MSFLPRVLETEEYTYVEVPSQLDLTTKTKSKPMLADSEVDNLFDKRMLLSKINSSQFSSMSELNNSRNDKQREKDVFEGVSEITDGDNSIDFIKNIK